MAAGAAAVGVDISPPMVDAARRRVPEATVLTADAQTADLLEARPWRTLRPGRLALRRDVLRRPHRRVRQHPGRHRTRAPGLAFVCWRDGETDMFVLGLRSLMAQMEAPPALPQSGEPGPMGLADPATPSETSSPRAAGPTCRRRGRRAVRLLHRRQRRDRRSAWTTALAGMLGRAVQADLPGRLGDEGWQDALAEARAELAEPRRRRLGPVRRAHLAGHRRQPLIELLRGRAGTLVLRRARAIWGRIGSTPGASDTVDVRVSSACLRGPRRGGMGMTPTNERTLRGMAMADLALDFPVNDADNHMYEPEAAFTRYLPDQWKGLVKYVQVEGRTKIALRNVISDYIPNPTFEVVARPGAQEEYFAKGNPEGKSRREIMGKADAVPGGLLRARAPHQAARRAGHRQDPHVADAGQPPRGAHRRRSRGHPRRDPRAEPVDARDVDLQLREPHLRHPGDHPADRRQGHRRARVGRRARRQGHPHPPGAGARLRGHPLVRPARVRPVLGEGRRGRHRRGHARLRRRHQRVHQLWEGPAPGVPALRQLVRASRS